jgi:hypothetical protein
MRQLAFIVVLLPLGNRLSAEEPVSGPARAKPAVADENEQAGAERQRRTDFMKALLGQYSMVTDDEQHTPLVLTEAPVLRYTNPVRNFHTDGAVFFWLEDERPFAAGSPTIRGTGQVFCEFTALTGQPLECRRNGRVTWAPRSGNLVDQSFPDAASPGKSDKLRLRQMREAARRFHVITKSDPDVELRLMAQPIYRFASESSGIIDGAVFAFVEATDPDFLLVVEAHRRRAASASGWRYTLARLCSRPVEVQLDGRALWSGEDYWTNPRSVSDSYAERLSGPYPPP